MKNETKHKLLDLIVEAEQREELPQVLCVIAEFCGPRRVVEIVAKIIDERRSRESSWATL